MLEYQIGNRKIGNDTLIINMGSAKKCPSGLAGLCPLFDNGKCYAMKAERMYKASLPYRNRQAKYWLRYSAEHIAGDILEVLARRPGIKYVRFNEAGDFYGQDCVNKLSQIAQALSGLVLVYTYTHRKDLDFSRVHENLTVNGSGFMVHNNFTTVRAYTPGARVHCANDCRACKICMKRRGVLIEVIQH